MQRLQPMHNPHFGSNIIILKNMSKSILQIIQTRSLQQIRSKKHQIFEKWDHFKKPTSMHRLQPMQNPHFGSKIKISKNMSKSILQNIYSCSVQKALEKTPNNSEMRQFLKSAIMQGLLILGQKLKLQKTCQNLFYKTFTVVLWKKPLEKKTQIIQK